MRSKYLGRRGSKAGHNVGESWTRDDGTRVTKVGPNQYREESPGGMAGRPAVQHEDQSRLPPAVRERAQQASDGMTAQMQDATDMASHRLAGEGASPQQQAAARQSVLGAIGRGIRGILQEYGQAHARDNPDMNRGPLHLASWAVTRAWRALRQKLGGKALLRRQAKFLHLAKDFDPEAAQQAAGDIQGLLDTLAGHLNVTAPKIDARELYSGGKGLWGRKWLGRRSSKAKRRERNKPYELHGEWWIIGDDNKRRPYRPGGAAGGGAAPPEEPAGRGTRQGSQPRARRRKQPAEPPAAKARVKTRQDTHGLTTELPPLSEARRQELAPAIDKAIAQAMLYNQSHAGIAPLHLVVRELQRAAHEWKPAPGRPDMMETEGPDITLEEAYAALSDAAARGRIDLYSGDSGRYAMEQAREWGQGELPVEEAAIWRNGNPLLFVRDEQSAQKYQQQEEKLAEERLLKDTAKRVQDVAGWVTSTLKRMEITQMITQIDLDREDLQDVEKKLREVLKHAPRTLPEWDAVSPEQAISMIRKVMHAGLVSADRPGNVQRLMQAIERTVQATALQQHRTRRGKSLSGHRVKRLRFAGRKSHDLADRIWQAIRFSGPMREITATREQDDDSIDMLVQEIEDEARYAGSALDAEQIWDDIYDAVHRHQGYDRAEAIQRVLRMAVREAGHLSKSLPFYGIKAQRRKEGEIWKRRDGTEWTKLNGRIVPHRQPGQGRGGRPQPSRESVGKLQSGLQSARGDLAKLILRDDQKAVSKLVASQFQQAGIKVNPGRVQRLVAGIVDKHGDITSQGDAHTIAENITRQALQQNAKLAVVPRGPRQPKQPASREPEPEPSKSQDAVNERLRQFDQFPGPELSKQIESQAAKLPVEQQVALARGMVRLAQEQDRLLDRARTPEEKLEVVERLSQLGVDTLSQFGIDLPEDQLREYGLKRGRGKKEPAAQ